MPIETVSVAQSSLSSQNLRQFESKIISDNPYANMEAASVTVDKSTHTQYMPVTGCTTPVNNNIQFVSDTENGDYLIVSISGTYNVNCFIKMMYTGGDGGAFSQCRLYVYKDTNSILDAITVLTEKVNLVGNMNGKLFELKAGDKLHLKYTPNAVQTGFTIKEMGLSIFLVNKKEV